MKFSTDKEKIEYIFITYGERMKSVAMRYLHNEMLAEDVVQISFFDIFKCISEIYIEDEDKIPPIIVRIIKCNTIDVIRKNARREELMTELTNLGKEFAYYQDFSQENIVIENLNKLKEKDREIIKLRLIYEMGYSEISKKLNVSTESARKRYERARKKLVKLIRREQSNEE